MPPITALLHTENDALRLGRCLETLYPCDQIVVIDHESRDATVHIARQYGARVIPANSSASSGSSPQQYPRLNETVWILALDPHESLTEGLAASLFEWKTGPKSSAGSPAAFSVFLREERADGWVDLPTAQTRLVPPGWNRWNGKFPAHHPSAVTLEGELLRFVFP
jgi:glycosyltransferase involved in cell wall biosynthesis